ncbi:MAG: type VI secretion system tip protein VgrG [Planctomycetales bacterium]|nr:type VI secretion system tip protein VgrG [Planctomycetales bacterium]
MALSQSERLLQLTTPLGADVLLLTSFQGRDEVSGLFEYQLSMMSDDNNIQANQIVGKDVTVRIEVPDANPRFFHGYVNSFVAGDEDREGRRNYFATMVPWMWFLTQTADCRIFQEKSIPEIMETIFQDLGFNDFETSEIKANHKQWEYCVQYRETDFAFVSRLMEQEGIHYHFRHEDGKHTLVMGDQNGAFKDLPEAEVDYPMDFGGRAMDEHITSWEHRYDFRPGKWAQTDYNFKQPSTSLMNNTNTVVDLPGIDKFEVYDYPGEYTEKSDGEDETKIRMEEEEAQHSRIFATSNCKTFSPGGKFKIGQHRCKSEAGKKYAILAIEHTANETLGYETGAGTGPDYSNSFTCIPENVVFRPARTTRKPIVQGVQTAVVTGPAGEEIYTDEFGRVKVQFHWDREGQKDENSSCWIRVSQNWAGQGWGVVFNPRIGQEVIVDFIEGDPDRPIITGRVYNAEQMPPYELPADQTKSTIKSRSSKGGGPDNFNEIRFEDKMGSEEMYIHAEKDQNTVVENDQSIVVGRDRTEEIGRDRRLQVDRDKYEEVKGRKSIHVVSSHTETIDSTMNINVGSSLTENVAVNYVENVGVAMTLNVGAALAISVGAALAQTVGGAVTEAIGAAKSETIGGNKSADVGGNASENVAGNSTTTVGKDFTETIGGRHAHTVDKEFVLNAQKIQLVAKDEICIKTGKAEIVMKKNGDISISGKKISVKGSGDVIIKGSQIKEN